MPRAPVRVDRAKTGSRRRWRELPRPHLVVWLLAAVALMVALAPTAVSRPEPQDQQPYPDAIEYEDAAYHLVHDHRYETSVREPGLVSDGFANYDRNGSLHASRYPPGFSLTLAPFVKWGGSYPASAVWASKLFALLLIAAVGLAATRLGGPLSGAVAAGILGLSPFPRAIGRVSMSDGFAALLAVVCLALLVRSRWFSATLAGVVSGWGVLVRLAGIVMVGAAAIALAPRRRMWLAVAGAAPFVVALLVYQAATFGGPLKNGYTHYYAALPQFSVSYVLGSGRDSDGVFVPDQLHGAALRPLCDCSYTSGRSGKVSNLAMYLMTLAGGVWVFAPPLIPLIGAWELVRQRRTEAARYSIAVVLGSLLVYLPYFYQSVRFMAAAGVVLVVYTGVGIGRFLGTVATGRGRVGYALAYGFGVA
jgi:4-amino-4-deoxy-L-arabinose transferase-like glycosyltransferase